MFALKNCNDLVMKKKEFCYISASKDQISMPFGYIVLEQLTLKAAVFKNEVWHRIRQNYQQFLK